jgi:hypothetical protein
MTQMVRRAEGLSAHIAVSRLDDVVEFIAHEIEHVIKQIEGVDLARQAPAFRIR